MSKEIIKKIVIDLAGTEVTVTPLQAKALHAALAELLGLDKPKVVEREVYRDRYPYWPYPTITKTIDFTGTKDFPQPMKVWYATDSQTAMVKVN
jgi:hypothetical protein